MSQKDVRRLLLLLAAMVLAGCNPGLEFTALERWTPNQLLGRASHIFIGVVENHEYQIWPLFRVPGLPNRDHWRILRRRVHLENVLRGKTPDPFVNIYEIFWVGDACDSCNSTEDRRRYLFLVQVENRRYHVVRDMAWSVFQVNSGWHSRLPLDASTPFWERVALMMWWIQPGWNTDIGNLHADPGFVLGRWRKAKILRGLFRHPERELRLIACEALLHLNRAQDECWDTLSEDNRKRLNRHHSDIAPEDEWRLNRRYEGGAIKEWDRILTQRDLSAHDTDAVRLLTTINNPRLRACFCREFQKRFPNDKDCGCPANQAPPATIVTEAGDIPLTGLWPDPR